MSNEYVRMKKATMDSIAKAIQEREGSTDKIPGAEMPARIEAISGGLALETKARQICLTSLNVLGKAEATINLDNATTLEYLFYAKNIVENVNTTVEHLTINCPNPVTSINDMLNGYRDETLRHLTLNIDTSAADRMRYAFYGNYALEIIDGTPLDASSVTIASYLGNMFHLCYALRDVRFKGVIRVSFYMEKCENISKETIVNVFGCLADDAEGHTAAFHKGRIDKLFETSEGAADGSSSAEWLALVATKPNWTISLRS